MALSSKDYIFGLLGQGHCLRFSSDSGKTLFLIRYPIEILNELTRALGKSHLDVSKLDLCELSAAILKSSKADEINGSRNYYILSDYSSQYLNGLGLHVSEEHFEPRRCWPDLAMYFMQSISNPRLITDDDCFALFEALISHDNLPIEKIFDSGVISALVPHINQGYHPNIFRPTPKSREINIISRLLRGGNVEEHVAIIMNAGFVSNLKILFERDTNELSTKDACEALRCISNTSSAYRCELMKARIHYDLAMKTKYIKDEDVRNACIETCYSICQVDQGMSINDFHDDFFDLQSLPSFLSVNDDGLVEMGCSALQFHLDSVDLTDPVELNCAFANLLKFVLHKTTHLQDMALELMDRIATQGWLPTVRVGVDAVDLEKHLCVLTRYLEDDSEETVAKACRLIGHILLDFMTDRGFDRPLPRTKIVKWLDAIKTLLISRPHDRLNLSPEFKDSILLCVLNTVMSQLFLVHSS
jgi:hypothetical protein